jgi:hypothetical protein
MRNKSIWTKQCVMKKVLPSTKQSDFYYAYRSLENVMFSHSYDEIPRLPLSVSIHTSTVENLVMSSEIHTLVWNQVIRMVH